MVNSTLDVQIPSVDITNNDFNNLIRRQLRRLKGLYKSIFYDIVVEVKDTPPTSLDFDNDQAPLKYLDQKVPRSKEALKYSDFVHYYNTIDQLSLLLWFSTEIDTRDRLVTINTKDLLLLEEIKHPDPVKLFTVCLNATTPRFKDLIKERSVSIKESALFLANQLAKDARNIELENKETKPESANKTYSFDYGSSRSNFEDFVKYLGSVVYNARQRTYDNPDFSVFIQHGVHLAKAIKQWRHMDDIVVLYNYSANPLMFLPRRILETFKTWLDWRPEVVEWSEATYYLEINGATKNFSSTNFKENQIKV